MAATRACTIVSVAGALLSGACSAPIRSADPAPAPAPAVSAQMPMPPGVVPDAAVGVAVDRRDRGAADLDPDNDGVVGPPDVIADCSAVLERAGVHATPSALPVHKDRGGRITCGAPQVVVYKAGPEAIRYNIAPQVTCRMALSLARFETILQEETIARLGKRVVRIDQAGTYSCRKIARFRHMVSEHSYANAIDVTGVTLEDGRRISVLAHFGATNSVPAAPESQLLRAVARRLFDEAVFSVVLTPFFDAGHRDHFHLDMARYRTDGTR